MGEGGNKVRIVLFFCLISKLLGEKENKFKKLVFGKLIINKIFFLNVIILLIIVNYYFFIYL